jgi:hypothetical protein
LVNIAAKKPNRLKLISNELHRVKPSIIGKSVILVQKPVCSPISILDMATVNIGEDDLTVSTNEIAACLSATNPNIIENNLKDPIISMFRQKLI